MALNIINDTLKLALLGHPVAHSQSPALHNAWLRDHNLNGAYTAIDCAPDTLGDTVQRLKSEHYRGFNVTVPHKQTIMPYCDYIDDLARAVGAVNTVTIKDGVLYGTNTDVYGLMENLRRQAPNLDLRAANAVIIGAGGAARAAVHGLLTAGVANITLTNRTYKNAENLSAASSDPSRVTIMRWENRQDCLKNCTLLVNTTALGMAEMPPLQIPLNNLPLTAAVYDIVYKPLMTDLLTNAKSRTNTIITGDGMLLHQARLAFEHWTGILPAA